MKNLIVCLLAISLSIASSVVAADPNPPPFNGDFTANGRGASPYTNLPNYNANLSANNQDNTAVQGPYHVHVSRHHIIPYNVLQRFYNAVQRQNSISRLSGFLKALAKTAPLWYGRQGNAPGAARCGANVYEAGYFAVALANNWYTQSDDNQPTGEVLEQFNSFYEFYTWMPWNLFIGPEGAIRSDDPGEGFENNAHVVIGQTTFNTINALYQDMLSYITNPNNTVLARISQSLSRLAARRAVYALNRGDWVLRNGRWQLDAGRRLASFTPSTRLLAVSNDVEECGFEFNIAPPSTFTYDINTLF
ncbi:MAG: hypothetical protein ACI9SP_000076 [Arenicella sp.]|jgi:hypothetical protein